MLKKKVLILGASSDIGVEVAKKYFNENKYLLDLHYNNNFKALKNFKPNCKIIKSDFSKITFNNVLKKFRNDYDIIINLVGFINNKSYDKSTIKSLEKTIRINSLIPMFIIKNSIKKMIKKRWGRILNSTSIGVKFGGGLLTYEYSLSKHINEFIPSFLKKISENNVFYNVIKIGLTNTKAHKKIPNKKIKERIKLVPAKKMASPKDIADYIYFVCSKKNQFITNEIFTISGGE